MSAPEANNPVLLNTFFIGKKSCRVYFHHGTLIWDSEKSSQAHYSLPIENVIAVKLNNVNSHTSSTATNLYSFTVHYAIRGPKSTWKYTSVTFKHNDSIQVASWVKTLENHLNTFTQRPKKLLLFVNPFGGKKKALKIFEKHGKKLFNIAGVEINLIVSQRANQIRDLLLIFDLKNYDGIACVGGDGTFSEVFNGLVLRACRENGINANDIEVDLPDPKIPVGVIPGGSTDTIAYCLHGTTDVETAVLQIIFGDCSGFDLVSVYNENSLLKLYASVLSYGYLGDVALESEKYRWMGPKRYDFTGFKKFLLNEGYESEITVCLEDEDEENAFDKCLEGCQKCRKATVKKRNAKKSECVWKTVKGKYFMVSGANISCACDRSPNGIAPLGHVGDGYVQLVLVRHTSMFNNLRLLIRLSSKNKSVCDLSFVEYYRAKEFCFRACPAISTNNDPHTIPGFSKWNCDGEIIYDTDLRVKVRCQLLSVYTRGMQEQVEVSCCGRT